MGSLGGRGGSDAHPRVPLRQCDARARESADSESGAGPSARRVSALADDSLSSKHAAALRLLHAGDPTRGSELVRVADPDSASLERLQHEAIHGADKSIKLCVHLCCFHEVASVLARWESPRIRITSDFTHTESYLQSQRAILYHVVWGGKRSRANTPWLSTSVHSHFVTLHQCEL